MRTLKNLPWRIARAWSMLRLYWNTGDYDWATIAELMRHQIRRTRECITDNDIAVNADRYARQMLIVEALLDRMLNDRIYFEMATRRFPDRGRAWARMVSDLERQDAEMLGHEIARHLTSWWD